MAEKSRKAELGSSQFGVSRLRPGTLQVTLGEEVGVQDLHVLVDRILKLNGCINCGLAGIDILMRGVDPVIFQNFSDIGGVRDVTLVR